MRRHDPFGKKSFYQNGPWLLLTAVSPAISGERAEEAPQVVDVGGRLLGWPEMPARVVHRPEHDIGHLLDHRPRQQAELARKIPSPVGTATRAGRGPSSQYSTNCRRYRPLVP
jgi:hypothetical protein